MEFIDLWRFGASDLGYLHYVILSIAEIIAGRMRGALTAMAPVVRTARFWSAERGRGCIHLVGSGLNCFFESRHRGLNFRYSCTN
jgi:hypothetical protein